MFYGSLRWGKSPCFSLPLLSISLGEACTILHVSFSILSDFSLFHRERYLGTLLRVEGMLKAWFPHIAARKSSLGGSRHQINKVRTSKLRKRWEKIQELDCVWRNGFLFPSPLRFLLVVVFFWFFQGMPNFVHSCTFYI